MKFRAQRQRRKWSFILQGKQNKKKISSLPYRKKILDGG